MAPGPEPLDRPESLLVRVASGDGSAVTQLVDRYGGLIWSLASRQLGNDVAEDLVQEVFVELWRTADRFDPARSSEATFITMVARRRIIDVRRRIGSLPEQVELVDDRETEEAEVDARLEVADEVTIAREALSKVTPVQKQVLELSLLQGLTHTEIAARTELPLGTVKSHLRRGLDHVRRLLAKTEEVQP